MLEPWVVVLRWAGVFLAAVAGVQYVKGLTAASRPAGIAPGRLVVAAVLCLSGALAARGFELSTVPLVSALEALLFYAWLLLVVFLVLVRREAHRTLGALLVPLAALLGGFAAAFMAPPAPVSTLFHNRYFALHTVSLFLGYSALSVAFCAGVMYLLLFDEIAHKRVGRMSVRLPSLDDLDRLGHHTVLLGFALLTTGIVIGMIWARTEWGVLWVWEAKSVWTLLSWAVYLGYLLSRNLAGWQGPRAAWLATLGFALAAATFVGTNVALGSGRHAF